MVLDCFLALEDEELTKKEKIATALIIFYDGFETIADLDQFDVKEAFEQMCLFFNCGQPEVVGKQMSYSVIDWDKDSQLICSAINKVAGKEIREQPYLHWWTFMGYFLAIGQSSLSTVVSIRDKIMHGKKLEKWEKDFRINNPKYFMMKSKEDKEAEELFKQLWKEE